MASLGALQLATRIVDDLEILVCLCRVLSRSSPRPSRRRVLKALLRTIGDDRGGGVMRRGGGKATATAAVAARFFGHGGVGPGAAAAGADTDEGRRLSLGGGVVDEPGVVAEPAAASAAVSSSSRLLDEVALYGSWRAVASKIVVPRDPPRSASAMAMASYLAARFFNGGQKGGAILWSSSSSSLFFFSWWPSLGAACTRGLLAHPFETLAVRTLFTTAAPPEGHVTTAFWASARGSVSAAFLDVNHLGLGAAPRLLGLVGGNVRLLDALLHARLSLACLPSAVAAVALARVLAFVLFGASKRRAQLERRLEAYLGSSASGPGGTSSSASRHYSSSRRK
eukprot:CAMPEP_0118897484 /NCGR_PEP_ID=MMETSP1166-20130328/4860_1 /TAXON_ID=1104430 /ORGANISM="Chrysoreinhardia sp, Strain CCMP3193" /LENGTH=338 /DNA_ID=CAMNT_0006836555 /DNA_START=5 /DNA_END=1021 /DNA_ORIENTATION=-